MQKAGWRLKAVRTARDAQVEVPNIFSPKFVVQKLNKIIKIYIYEWLGPVPVPLGNLLTVEALISPNLSYNLDLIARILTIDMKEE